MTTRSEFRLGRPFLPGTMHEPEDAVAVAPIAAVTPVAEPREPPRTDRERLPPIDVFLEDDAFEGDEESRELPPVEHFMDPLPVTGGFAPDAAGALLGESAMAVDIATATTGRPETEAGWGVDDWQRYDWRAAATLGEGVESQASSEWATTNWDIGTPGARKKLSAAQAIANALDQIAQQIREGDVTIPSPSAALTDPGAIAATLAALLGVRR